MNKFTEFNRTNIDAAHAALVAAMAKFTADTGIAVEVGNLRFNENQFNVKLECKIEGTTSVREQASELGLALQVKKHNLVLKNAAGQELVDFKPRRPQYPFIMKDTNGKEYKLSLEYTKSLFAKK